MDTKTVLLNSLSLTETYYQPKVMQGWSVFNVHVCNTGYILELKNIKYNM